MPSLPGVGIIHYPGQHTHPHRLLILIADQCAKCRCHLPRRRILARDLHVSHSTTTSKRRGCAIYTGKSTEEGLERSFNSLLAKREACEAYIKSQQHEGWIVNKASYDDGGYSGGNVSRPALRQLLEDIWQHGINIVVVYKVDPWPTLFG